MHSVRYRPARANGIWLGTAGVTVLAALIAAFRLSPPGCPAAAGPSPPAAARPAAARPATGGFPAARPGTAGSPASPRPGLPGAVYTGRALFYDPGTALGSCTLGPFRTSGWYASLSRRQFAHGHACGTYLDVQGPAGTVRAEVVDMCPTCHSRTIVLSRSAYGQVGDPRPGVAPVTYQWLADPKLPGPLALRVSAPAPDVLAVQVINNGNRLTSVAISRSPAGPAFPAWHRLQLDPDNFWVTRGITSPGPFTVQIVDALGHHVLLPGVTLIPGTVTRTGSWMYRPGQRGRTRHAAPPARTRPAPRRAGSAAGCPDRPR
jgi:endoglucanase